ncbi:MAG TPA: amidohydrolase family protein [Luteolibacter sp.]|nr:amidohydrolase family protein [Luteolibacter sp.]
MSPALRKIDCHVHLVGDGSSGSGCWLQMRTPIHEVMAKVIVRLAGLPGGCLKSGLDEVMVDRLVDLVRTSTLDSVVLLAQDVPHLDNGTPKPEFGAFHVPNEYLLKVCGEHPQLFIPAVSIHPSRRDAMEELERCLEAGARVLKLLPNCLNVDYSDRRHQRFFERMAEAGMILLSHTGGELSLPVLDPHLADPRLLEQPLDCGVTVIAAHCAGRAALWDEDYTDILIGMFAKWPKLYADNSALCSFFRCQTLPKILGEGVQERILHGSDFPIAVGGFGPWRVGLIDSKTWRAANRDPNVLERDAYLKRQIGFSEETFTRMAELLQK